MKLFEIKINAGFFASGLLALAVLGGGCRQAGQAGKPVIGASMRSLQSEFSGKVKDAVEAEARERQIRMLEKDAQRAAVTRVQQGEGFMAQGVDGIILNPCEMDASSPAGQKARAAGIPIINVNSETTAEPAGFVG